MLCAINREGYYFCIADDVGADPAKLIEMGCTLYRNREEMFKYISNNYGSDVEDAEDNKIEIFMKNGKKHFSDSFGSEDISEVVGVERFVADFME